MTMALIEGRNIKEMVFVVLSHQDQPLTQQ